MLEKTPQKMAHSILVCIVGTKTDDDESLVSLR